MKTYNTIEIKKLWAVIIISLLGIIVYSNTFHGSFQFDDDYSIVDNPSIKNIHHLYDIWEFLPRRFILFLSLALNYHFNQLNVGGYHLFNLGIHLLSAFLVWWLVLLILSTPAMKNQGIAHQADIIALSAGLIFVSHPLQTEAVTYIVQRAASLMTMFYLASLCLYIKSRLEIQHTSLQRIYYVLSLITAVLAMFTKEIAITLPLMLVLVEYTFFCPKKRISWKPLSPFLLTLFIIPLTMLMTETKAADLLLLRRNPGVSTIHYLLTQFRVIVTYIRLLLLPLNQNLDYDYAISKSLFEIPTLTSFLFLGGIFYVAVRLFSKYKLPAFAIFFFFLTLIPTSSIVPRIDVIVEHRLYLPLVGYSLFLVSGLYYLLGRNSLKTMVIVLGMIIAFNSILTYERNKVWKDEITLWSDVIKKSPHKARSYYGLGLSYYRSGHLTRSILAYNKAIELDPFYEIAYINRGCSYYAKGLIDQALTDLNKAIEINPDIAKAYYSRGDIYAKLNQFDQALSDYTKALEINPQYVPAYINRGNIYFMKGDLLQALSNYNKAIGFNPGSARAYRNRAIVYYRLKEYQKALADAQQVIGLNKINNPDNVTDDPD